MLDLYGTAFNRERFEASLKDRTSESGVVSACRAAAYAIDEDCSERRKKLLAAQDELDEMKTLFRKLSDAVEGQGYLCATCGIDNRAIGAVVNDSLMELDDARNHAVNAAFDTEDALNAVSRRRDRQLDEVDEARRLALRKFNDRDNC